MGECAVGLSVCLSVCLFDEGVSCVVQPRSCWLPPAVRLDTQLGVLPFACAEQQRFPTFVRPRPGKFFFHKSRVRSGPVRSQQIYS